MPLSEVEAELYARQIRLWGIESQERAVVPKCGGDCTPIIVTENGKLQGKILKSRAGLDVFSFLGVPFAQPPLGQLRFQAPSPFGQWNGTLNATKVHPVCPQRDIYRRSEEFEGDEDCLYLNVYTPKLPVKNDSDVLPVMVFFHGGGWLCGGGNTHWYGPDIMVDQNVVLVVPNYRLGALGFLSTGDHVVPGNNGLKDQNVALKWVQRNIRAFGGDPNSVTIFGESAGGASVHYHMLSPLSAGLFHRAIAMSGTALCVWAHAPQGEPVENARKLAKSLDCPTESSESMIQCLRKVDAMEIARKDVVFMKWDFDPMIPFKPTVEPVSDGAFLTQNPLLLIRTGQVAAVPLILGVTKEDGALRAAAILNSDDLLSDLNRDFAHLIPLSLMYDKTAQNVRNVTERIRKFYFDNGAVTGSNGEQLVNLYTDGWFVNCADKTVEMHRKYTTSPVYLYLFAHRGRSSFTQIFGGGSKDYGVCHADDLQYLFPVGDDLFPDQKPSEEDLQVQQLFSSSFANFARTSDPSPADQSKWSPVQSEDLEHYLIESKSPGMRSAMFARRTRFWRSLSWMGNAPTLRKIKDEL